MNLRDRIFGRKQEPKIESRSSADVFRQMFASDDLTTATGQAREGYANNPFVRRACDIMGVLVSIPDPLVQDKEGNELKDHPLSILLKKRPNKRMSKTQFFRTIGTHLELYGETFLYPIWTVKGVSAIEIADPQCVQVVETGDPWNPVAKYIINRGTAGMMNLPPEEIIHIKFYNPESNNSRGMSPIVSAKRSIEMQNSIRDWNISTTRNGAKTSLIIETDRTIPKDQKEKLAQQLQDRYGGKSNAGMGMILDDGKKASTVGMTAVEMDFNNGQTQCGREISISGGIPSELLGDSQNKTYSNVMEAYKQLVQMTGIPFLQTVYDALTMGILHSEAHPNAYPEVERITYDPEPINDITVDKASLYTAIESATYLTINEKREKLGYDPINDPMAETPLVNMSLSPLSDMALDNEPVIDDETPFLNGEDDAVKSLAQTQQDKPKEAPKTPTFQSLVGLGKDSQ